MEPLLDKKDAGRIAHLSRSTINRLIERGVLPVVRLPGVDRILIAPADLRAFLEAGRTAAMT